MTPSLVPILLAAGVLGALALSRQTSPRSPSKTTPTPTPTPIPSNFRFPIGTVVRARTRRRQAGTGFIIPREELVKIVDNEPSLEGDYEVIAADCFLPDALCSSTHIEQKDILP